MSKHTATPADGSPEDAGSDATSAGADEQVSLLNANVASPVTADVAADVLMETPAPADEGNPAEG